MRRSCVRFVKYVIGFSIALIAVSNCFNVLSSSSAWTALPTVEASRAEQANLGQRNSSLASLTGTNHKGSLFESNLERAPVSRAALATRASAISAVASPFAPIITATKSHALAPGDTQADPGDTLTYTVVISNTGASDATGVNFSDTIDPNTTLVPGSLIASPIAVDDSYHTIGNVNIQVPVGQGVIANDSNPNGSGTLTVTKVNATTVPGGGSATASTANGSVTMSSDGSFSYTPNVAFRGPSDSFTYTLDNGTGKTDTATVTISVNGLIWFVDFAAAPGGDGRLATPFNCLVGPGCFDPVAADIANDNIFVYSGAYTGGLALLSGQKLIGQGASQTLLTITGLPAPSGNNLLPSTGGANPTITSASDGVSLGSNNQIWGVTFGNKTGAGISGANFGTLTVRDTTINGTGQALNLSIGTLDAIFQSLSSTTSSSTGITINATAGSMSVTGATSITDASGAGVNLTNNTGTISFTTLDITSTTQSGLVATDNSNTITAAGGAITSLTGTPVNITRSTGTTPLNITLTSVSANGAANGIVLSNTSGSFSVTGSGTTAGSGGTIQFITSRGASFNSATNVTLKNMNFINAAATNGTDPVAAPDTNPNAPVFCQNVTNVTLDNLVINGSAQDGIYLNNVTGFSVSGSSLSGIGNEVNENGIRALNLLGASSITNTSVTGSNHANVRINNTTGTLTLTVSGSSFNSSVTHDGFDLVSDATANTTLSISSSNFNSNFSDGFDGGAFNNSSTATSNISLTTSNFNNNGANGILIATAGSADVKFNVFSNTSVTGNPSSGINVFQNSASTSTAKIRGKIDSNTNITYNTAAGGGTGVIVNAQGAGTATVEVTNNTVNYNNGGNTAVIIQSGSGSNGSTIVKFTANTINVTGSNPLRAINMESGLTSASTRTICLNAGTTAAGDNTVVTRDGAAAAVEPLRVRKRPNSFFNIQGITPNPSTTAAQVQAYLSSVTGLATSDIFVSGPTTFQINYTDATCNTTAAQSVPDTVEAMFFDRQEDTLRVGGGEGPGGKDVSGLDQSDLDWIVRAAIQRWVATGISNADLARINSLTFEVADLSDRQLASATTSKVLIDKFAAGRGWFVDPTPFDDSEFETLVGNDELHAGESSPAFGRVDLLTAIMRELAYVLHKDTTEQGERHNGIMGRKLPPSVRRLPEAKPVGVMGSGKPSVSSPVKTTEPTVKAVAEVEESNRSNFASGLQGIASYAIYNWRGNGVGRDGGNLPVKNASFGIRAGGTVEPAINSAMLAGRAAAASPMFSGETVTLNIGTIPPGESVTIMFQVTINNPLPNGACSVTNQGHVTGSNFSQVDTNSDVTPIAKPVTIGACPANVTTNTDPGVCTAVVVYTTPTGDGCPTPTVTCNPPSGFAFPKGTTTVTCTATNGNPPDAACSFTVTVNDNEPPAITCPANITQGTDAGQCSAVVTYSNATASDNCPGVGTPVCTPASGSTFAKGTTTVNCSVSDASGNTANCSFTVTVVDNQSPTIGACPAPIATNSAPGQCSAVVNYTTPSASDNCPGVTVGCNPPSGSAFPKGTTTVTCTATDTSNNTASCSFTVTVIDNQPPSITCPGNINTDEDSPGSGCATVTYTTPTPSDNCPGATANCSPPSGTCFPVGTTTVTCTAMDTSGNTSSCQFTVTVNQIGLTALSPAKVWIGLRNSDDVGTKFDLLAEVLRNGMVVGSGQINDVPGGSSGFNNAVLRTITLALSSAVPMGPGDTMSFRLSVRIAATSGHNTGTARLWYNGAAIDSGASRDAGSRFDATIRGTTSDYFLRSPGFTLDTTAGSSRTFVDKTVSNSGGNPFVAFGTWSKTF